MVTRSGVVVRGQRNLREDQLDLGAVRTADRPLLKESER
jgi:hypothetical protein